MSGGACRTRRRREGEDHGSRGDLAGHAQALVRAAARTAAHGRARRRRLPAGPGGVPVAEHGDAPELEEGHGGLRRQPLPEHPGLAHRHGRRPGPQPQLRRLPGRPQVPGRHAGVRGEDRRQRPGPLHVAERHRDRSGRRPEVGPGLHGLRREAAPGVPGPAVGDSGGHDPHGDDRPAAKAGGADQDPAAIPDHGWGAGLRTQPGGDLLRGGPAPQVGQAGPAPARPVRGGDTRTGRARRPARRRGLRGGHPRTARASAGSP